LYNIHTPGLFNLAMQLTAGDKPVAEEIVQKTWVLAVAKLKPVLASSGLKYELDEILIDCSRSYYHKHESYMLINEHTIQPLVVSNSASDKPAGDMNMERALNFLPVGYRHVLVLHDIRGYKHRQIGGLLQIGEGISKSQLFNARQVLRQLLQQHRPAKARQILEWDQTDLKVFRRAYSNNELPDKLREKVINNLFDKGLILPKLQRANTLRGFRWHEFYLFGNKLTHQ
jgi:RNA polymerase sigma-70 factor (ECF subfamily)